MTTQTTNLLLVDSDPANAAALTRVLGELAPPWTLGVAAGLDEARVALAAGAWHAVLLDGYSNGSLDVAPLAGRGANVPIIRLARAAEAADPTETFGHDVVPRGPTGRVLWESVPAIVSAALRREETEQALKHAKALYQDLFDDAPDMYFIVDADGFVRAVNRQGARELGYRPEELIGEHVRKVIFPADEARVLSQVKAVFGSPAGDVHRLSFRKIRRDGSVMHVAERISSFVDEDGTSCIRILCRDVTERICAEQRELDLRQRLARSERLESMAALAGGVAHDLNNVLGPLVGYPDLLMQQFDESSQSYRDLLEIKKSTARAVDIVRDLLVLARRGRIEMTPVGLNDIVREAMLSAEVRAMFVRNTELRGVMELAPELPRIIGSPAHLGKAVANLVMNACESMPHGGTLTVRTTCVTLATPRHGFDNVPRGRYVVVSVVDTATPFADADRPHIFEPFYMKKKLRRGGTGLGLAIVYGVTHDHDGYVDLCSAPAAGNTFSLYFPVGAANGESADRSDTGGAPGGSESILVVDDMSEQRELAVRFLGRLGYRVSTAASGHEAVEVVRRRVAATPGDSSSGSRFDLILLDMLMEEGFDGLDTYRRIAELVPGQKCIIASGYAETERVRKALSLGVGQYLLKPYTLRTLAETVRAELDRGAPDSTLEDGRPFLSP